MDRITQVDEYIETATKEQQAILQKLRKIIEQAVPETKEGFKWKQPVYSTQKNFCYLKFTKKHVTLGFFNFEPIDDTQNLLEGTGKRMRHIKIHQMEDIQENVFKTMLKQAASF